MDIEKLKKRKAELGYTNEDVARMSGLPLGTVQKIFGGATKVPRRETYRALAEVLDPEYISYLLQIEKDNAAYVREEAMALEKYEAIKKRKKPGEYTLEDYYAIPDERRVELIDGVIYDMTAPSATHQIIAGEIFGQIRECVQINETQCIPLISPIDVQLDCDEKTMVQPDVIVVCDTPIPEGKVVFGAPEFAVEVLSPSTRSKDQLVKLNKYLDAGVREVWIVDPEMKRVMVYYFERNEWPEIYSFEDIVPVAISEGKCRIDFNEISDKLERLSKRFTKTE